MITSFVVSCVDDENVDFPDTSQTVIVPSSGIVSLLNTLKSRIANIPEEEQCFRFQYPIILGYNNDSNITIDNYSGLQSVLSGQSENFNVTGIQFPIQVLIKATGQSTSIQNENSLLNLLNDCNYTTVREEFDRLFRQCFIFDYPIAILDNNQTEVLLNTEQEFDEFYANQAASYQPDFQFPIDVLVGPNAESTTINTYFDFYEIADNCVGCPQTEIAVTTVNPNTFTFSTDFEVKPEYQITWIIDNVPFDFGQLGNSFTRVFAPGAHSVCIMIISPDCPLGIEICEEVTAETDCPALSFEQNSLEPLLYEFTANLESIGQTSFQWTVDGIFAQEGGGTFQFTFLGPGTYEVCIETDFTEFCPEGTSFCRSVIIEENCPDLDFTSEPESGTLYSLIPSIRGLQNDVNLIWTVDDIFIDNQISSNTVTHDFMAPGTYNVCVRIQDILSLCPDGVEICRQVVVP